jgi:diguanylate cyclase (GGDEF)-like protein
VTPTLPFPGRPLILRLGALVALVSVYVIAGKLGLRLASVSPNATPVWAPTGIALAAVLLFGPGVWPALFLSAFLVNATTAGTVVSSLCIAGGNTLEALIGGYCVNRWAGGRAAFHEGWTILNFLLLAAVLSTLVSATVGTATLLAGGAHWADAGSIWTTWWLGDAVGDIAVAPVLILWSEPWHALPRGRIVEALAIGLGVVAMGGVVFDPWSPLAQGHYALGFICIPILVWAAFRFGARAAMTGVLVLAAIAVRGTLHAVGPFALATPNGSLLLLQAFIGVLAVTSLILAASVTERRRAEAQLRVLSHSDPLTGLANYRELMVVLGAEIGRFQRTQRPFAVLFFDLDDLKGLNDRYGHVTGSRALCRVAEALRSSCRVVDTPARYGGDEFAVVLPESDEEAALLAGRRMAGLLSEDPEHPPVSASFGVAVCPRDGATAEALLATADRVLYTMKQGSYSKPSAEAKIKP